MGHFSPTGSGNCFPPQPKPVWVILRLSGKTFVFVRKIADRSAATAISRCIKEGSHPTGEYVAVLAQNWRVFDAQRSDILVTEKPS